MDVGGAALDRVDQHLVDELDHRGVVALGVDAAFAAGLVLAAGDVEIVEALGVVHAAERILRVHPQLHGALDGVLVDQNRFDLQIGMELDLVQRRGVGRIGDADEEAAAAFEQRQDVMLVEQFVLDQADRALAGVHRRRVEQRHAEFDGIGRGELRRGDQLLLAQVVGDRFALAGGRVQRLAGGRLVQSAVQHQTPGDAGDPDQVGSVRNVQFTSPQSPRGAHADHVHPDDNIETA